MGFGDKLKDLREQAQETVAEHRDQIKDAVETAGVVANQKTRGKHAAQIAKFGEKATQAVDKFATGTDGDEQAGEHAAGQPAAGAPSADQAGTDESRAGGPADEQV
jgi:MT0933-like antitoxin protein